MFLFDTNIFLEILLSQEKSGVCKSALTDNIGNICISDFSLHSIGVILFRYKKENVFNNFVSDILPKIDIVSLSSESYSRLSAYKDKYNMDFDDSYQCKVAEEKDLTITTMDRDFEHVEGEVKINFI